MNSIKRKLRSQRGASLLFALLFLLFCVLIGGTVLAAASASSFRVTRMENKQEELREQSSAQFVADELRVEGDRSFTLTIVPTGTGLAFSLPDGFKMTPMQRLTVEMAVWKYLKESGNSTTSVTLTNFTCDNGVKITKLEEFWYQYNLNTDVDYTGTVKLSGTNLVNEEVEFRMIKGSENYNLTVDFGEDSRYSVQMKGKFTQKEGSSTQSATIWWSEPEIKKGG